MRKSRAEANRFCRLQEQVRALENQNAQEALAAKPKPKLVDRLEDITVTNTVTLMQDDFDHGHVALNKSNTRYVLGEDIVFAPRPPKNENDVYLPEMMPNKDQRDANGAFVLGFFTAITIQANNIVLDLKENTISQSEEHQRRQRFFSVITLGDQPFPRGKGPADFGEFVSCENVRIENGTIGRSSHHGIQGNNCKNVLIQDVTVRDFEFAGIAINHAKDTILRRLHVGPSLRELPAKATLSAANFIVPAMEKQLDQLEAPAQDALFTLHNFLNDAHTFGTINEMQNTFGAGNNLPDGNVYGVMLHGNFHIDGFKVQRQKDARQPKHNVLVENVVVEGLKAGNQHVVALEHPDPKKKGPAPLTDRFKAVMHYLHSDVLTTTGWKPTPLLIVQAASVLVSDNAMEYEKKAAQFVMANIDGTTRKKALDAFFVMDNSSEDSSSEDSSSETSSSEDMDEFSSLRLRPVYGGDAMFHKCKGVLGIKIDGMHGVTVRGCEVRELDNVGSPLGLDYTTTENLNGSIVKKVKQTVVNGKKTFSTDDGKEIFFYGNQVDEEDNDPDETDHARYCGNDVRGVSVAGCQGVRLQDLGVSELASNHGPVTGVDVFNGSQMVHLENVIVTDLGSLASEPRKDDGINAVAATCGIRSRASVTAFSFTDCVVDWNSKKPTGAESIALRPRVRLRRGAGGEVCTDCLAAFDEFVE